MGVGWQEFVLILIVFFALISGDKLEEVTRFFGKTVREVRRGWDDIKREFEPVKKDFRKKKLIG